MNSTLAPCCHRDATLANPALRRNNNGEARASLAMTRRLVLDVTLPVPKSMFAEIEGARSSYRPGSDACSR